MNLCFCLSPANPLSEKYCIPPDPTPTPQNGSIVWENLNFRDEQAVATGSQLNLGNGITATVNWEVITDGGSFASHAGEDYVSFDDDTLGNHTGYLSLGFNNSKVKMGEQFILSSQGYFAFPLTVISLWLF